MFKYYMKQLNNLWFKCFSDKDTLNKMSAKTLVLKNMWKRQRQISAKKYFYFFWPGIYLKLETVHTFMESKKWINIMHICDYGSWHFRHSSLFINLKIILNQFKYSFALIFFKKLHFTPLRCYEVSVLVYWYLFVRLWVELFISKGLVQTETTVSK